MQLKRPHEKGDLSGRLFCYLAWRKYRQGASRLLRPFLEREAAAYQHKEQRHEEDSQHRGGNHPAHHPGTDGMLAAGARPGAGGHRQYAEDKRQ